MTRDTLELVAEAFGATPELLPLLPSLLADFRALGGWPEEIVDMLGKSAELPGPAAVIDMGCGKGGVSIAIAGELGYEVVGIDLFEPFLEEAVGSARMAGVGHLCSFEVADIRVVVGEPKSFDVAVFAAVGAGLFGDYAGCVGAIRQCVRPGGYLVISDGFLKNEIPVDAIFHGYEYYRLHDQVIREITAAGDLLVREILVPTEKLKRQNLHDLRSLHKRAGQLARAHPQHIECLQQFLASQEAEYAFLEKATVEAVWLLNRT